MKLSRLCFAVFVILYGLIQLNPSWTVLHHWVLTLAWLVLIAAGVLAILEEVFGLVWSAKLPVRRQASPPPTV